MNDKEVMQMALETQPWCMAMNNCENKCEDCPDKPKREWVGLTDEDVVQVFNVVIEENKGWPERRYRDFAKYIEAKLKEKNNG